jgi:hypothetical protein
MAINIEISKPLIKIETDLSSRFKKGDWNKVMKQLNYEAGLFYFDKYYLMRFSKYAERYLGYVASASKQGIKYSKTLVELIEESEETKVLTVCNELGFLSKSDLLHAISGKGIKDIPSKTSVYTSARLRWGIEFKTKEDTKHMFKLIKAYVKSRLLEGVGKNDDYIPLVSDDPRTLNKKIYDSAQAPTIKATNKGVTISHRINHPLNDKTGKVMQTLKATNAVELKSVAKFMSERVNDLVIEMLAKGDIKQNLAKPNPKKPRVKVEIKGKKRDLS